MIEPADFDSVLVTVAHNWGDVEVSLAQWAKDGPGPRPFLEVISARTRTGEVIPLTEIPPEYLNTPETRRLQQLGQLPSPWENHRLKSRRERGHGRCFALRESVMAHRTADRRSQPRAGSGILSG
jgi:hypothetical protein